MESCAFFGHHSVFARMEQLLRKTVIALITKKDVRAFYVGTHGEFDRMVYRVQKDISHIHDMVIYVVPAYIPGRDDMLYSPADTIFPDGTKGVSPRFAICYRNRFMMKKCTYVYLCNKSHRFGGGKVQRADN